MIEAYRTQHRDIGIDDVGSVEPAAQTDFEHHRVDRRVGGTASSAASVLYSKNVSVTAPRAASMRSKAASSAASLTCTPSICTRSL